MSREWEKSALCAQADPDEWFPERGASSKMAKSICERCTVAADCLEAALENEERYGIWGGLSYEERREMLAERGVEVDQDVDEIGEAA